jgi:hypothetical protein
MQRKEPAMKNATLPPLRVDSALRSAAESVLREGETLSGLVLEALHEFIARGLLAREEARTTGNYVSAEDMLARLDASLARARSKQAPGAQRATGCVLQPARPTIYSACSMIWQSAIWRRPNAREWRLKRPLVFWRLFRLPAARPRQTIPSCADGDRIRPIRICRAVRNRKRRHRYDIGDAPPARR